MKYWTYVQILDHEHPLGGRCGDLLHHPTPKRAKHYLYSTNSEGHHGFLLNKYCTAFIVGMVWWGVPRILVLMLVTSRIKLAIPQEKYVVLELPGVKLKMIK